MFGIFCEGVVCSKVCLSNLGGNNTGISEMV